MAALGVAAGAINTSAIASDTLAGGTGGSVSEPGTIPVTDSVEEVARAEEKMAMADAYWSWKTGSGTRANFVNITEKYGSTFGIKALGDISSSKLVSKLAVAAPTLTKDKFSVLGTGDFDWTSKTLDVTQRDQTKSYYCGPATASSILGFIHPGVSEYDGLKVNQANLAKGQYLQTDSSGGTPWADGRMKVTLNRWTSGSTTGWYVNNATPTTEEFRRALGTDTDAGYPLAANAVEFAGGYHYNNHPSNKTIGHWIPSRGYTSSGDTAKFADPAHSAAVSWGDLPNEYFTYSTNSFASRFLQSNGIVW